MKISDDRRELEELHASSTIAFALEHDCSTEAINYQPQVMMNFLKDYEAKLEIKITCSQETEPLGTAGPLALARVKLIDESGEPFFVLNSDVISDYPLKEMIGFHKSHGGKASIMVTKVRWFGRNTWCEIFSSPRSDRLVISEIEFIILGDGKEKFHFKGMLVVQWKPIREGPHCAIILVCWKSNECLIFISQVISKMKLLLKSAQTAVTANQPATRALVYIHLDKDDDLNYPHSRRLSIGFEESNFRLSYCPINACRVSPTFNSGGQSDGDWERFLASEYH